MRFIPTMLHGLADYAVGLFVMVLPFYFGWGGAERATFVSLGVIVLLYSLMTDYELGLFRHLRIRYHLLLNALFGIVMLALPALFNISDGALLVRVIGAPALLLAATKNTHAQGTRSGAAI